MANTDIIQPGSQQLSPPAAERVEQALQQMAQIMAGMADMVRATNDRMSQLEQQVRLLTKVTPAQATAINTAIKARSVELCTLHRTPGCEKLTANAIRKAIKLQSGAQSVRDLPRCDYSITMQQVTMWDDYKAMKAIKAKAAGKEVKP